MASGKEYLSFIRQIKEQILQSRFDAARLVNRELLALYHTVGMMISEKVKKELWGTAVIDNLSKDLQHQLPGIRGFHLKISAICDCLRKSTNNFQFGSCQLPNYNQRLIPQFGSWQLPNY